MLPEELLRDAISKEAGIKGEDAFALLEYLGAESAGSLTLLPPGQSWHEKTTLRPLSDETLSRRIAGLPRRTLTADSPKRMSLAGAQHKLLVVYHDRQLYEPQGAAASTHILKPLHPETGSYPASVINEYVTMRIAGAIGLPVPAVHIRYAPNPLYIVERFDRQIREIAITGDGAPTLEVARLHIIDACQLLNRSRTFKHTGASLDSLRRVIECTTNKLHSRLQLFRWLVFNIVMANDDCHLKNLSFFMASDGIKLAPFYDLLATGAYSTRAFAHEQSAWPDLPMAIELPGARVFGQVTGECVRAAAHELGVPTNAAHRILKEVITRVPLALDQETFNLEERHAALPLAARAYLAAETRLIGVLQHIIVPEMLQRLS
jgi:serine/threonine-protein kinase HipA